MAISREKKIELVAKYVEQIKASDAIIITDYRGLTVPDIQELRGKIREAEGAYVVVKNTLAQRALEEAGLPAIDDMLIGPVGIGFCNQNVPGVAKAITRFAKDNDALEVKGGVMDNAVIDKDTVKKLANLPTIDVLRAQLLGLINAPATQLTGVIAGSVRQVINVVNAYAEKDGEAAATEA